MHGMHIVAARYRLKGDIKPLLKLVDLYAEYASHKVTVIAINGDVDLPMPYIFLNCQHWIFVGATLKVGTPA